MSVKNSDKKHTNLHFIMRQISRQKKTFCIEVVCNIEAFNVGKAFRHALSSYVHETRERIWKCGGQNHAKFLVE